MRVRTMILTGTASLALASSHLALADNNMPPAPGTPLGQPQPASHINLNFTLPREEKFPGTGAHGANEPALQQGKPAEQGGSATGLHWTTVNSHPGVGYHLDKNEDLRVHFGGHGAVASYALHF